MCLPKTPLNIPPPQICAAHPVSITVRKNSLEDSVTRNCSGVCLRLTCSPMSAVSLGTVDDPWKTAGVSTHPPPPGRGVCSPPPLGPPGRSLGTEWRRDEESSEAQRGGDLLTRERSDGVTLLPVCLCSVSLSFVNGQICLSPFFPYLINHSVVPPPSPGLTLWCECIVYTSILQIALLSWIYMLLSPSGGTALAINFAQGPEVPWSTNKCWFIFVLCLPTPTRMYPVPLLLPRATATVASLLQVCLSPGGWS